MKKYFSFVMMLAIMVAALSITACSGDDDDNKKNNSDGFSQDYDVLQINGMNYACYGYRSTITYSSTWNLSNHKGELKLPCGKLSDAQKGKYNYDYMYTITIKGKQDLKKGNKLENFSPVLENLGDWYALDYVSGTATVIDKQDDKYITIKFDSFKCGDGGNSYTLNGTVQLELYED